MSLTFITFTAALLVYANFILMLHRSNAAGIMLIFAVAFSVGLFQFAGVPAIFPKLVLESLIGIFFFRVWFFKEIKGDNDQLFGFGFVIALLLISVGSFMGNSPPFWGFIYFLRIVFIPFLFFYTLLNIHLSDKEIERINKFLVFLFMLQIPAAILKFFTIGPAEDYIGTIGIESGSLSVFMPLFAISFLVIQYFNTRHSKYIWLMLGFLFIAIVGIKRAIFIYFPFLLILAHFLYAKLMNQEKFFNPKSIKNLFLIIGLSIVVFYAAVRIIPSLNPDDKVGGRFDPYFAWNYTQNYIIKEDIENPEHANRLNAPLMTYQMMKSQHMSRFLIGLGAGRLVHSRFVPESRKLLLNKYGLGYGARTGILWFFIQTGLLGATFFVLFYFALLKKIYTIAKKNLAIKDKLMTIGFTVVTLSLLLDFFTYSNAFIQNGALILPYFYIAVIILKKNNSLVIKG